MSEESSSLLLLLLLLLLLVSDEPDDEDEIARASPSRPPARSNQRRGAQREWRNIGIVGLANSSWPKICILIHI